MMDVTMTGTKSKVDKAIQIGVRYGRVDGDHHKMWVIDQMIRALTGCPMVKKLATTGGNEYEYEDQGESEEYKNTVREACAGEEGPDTYSWDCGIAP